MSKHNIQNRDHYTVAGRERPGKAAAQVTPHATNNANEEQGRWDRQQREKQDEDETSRGR